MTAEPLAHPGANPEAFLRALFDRAVAAADPMIGVPAALPPRKPDGRVLVIGAGKASARMAEAVEAHWGPCEGLVITRYGYGRPCKGIETSRPRTPSLMLRALPRPGACCACSTALRRAISSCP